MRNKKTSPGLLLKETAYKLLFEQEEDEADLFGDEEEEEVGDEPAPAEGEEAAAEEDTAEEEEEEVEVSPEEEYELTDSIDSELEALLVDFEADARKSAAVNKETVEESRHFLFETSADDIDLRDFAANVARLVKNYQNLIDWEKVILNKVEMFVNNHYGEETVNALFDTLDQEYGIERETRETEEIVDAPIAVGARGEGGVG
jgi:hypothetical protein